MLRSSTRILILIGVLITSIVAAPLAREAGCCCKGGSSENQVDAVVAPSSVDSGCSSCCGMTGGASEGVVGRSGSDGGSDRMPCTPEDCDCPAVCGVFMPLATAPVHRASYLLAPPVAMLPEWSEGLTSCDATLDLLRPPQA